MSVCDKEITKIFMEQGKYEFELEKYQLEAAKKKQKEFFLWLMAEYPERLMERMYLKWILTKCGIYPYKGKIFEFYKENKGLEALLEELEDVLSLVLEEEQLFYSSKADIFPVLSVIWAINRLEKMTKTKEEKEKITKTEQRCFEILKDEERCCITYYPVLFFMVAGYWYDREKSFSPDMAEKLLYMYFYWDENKQSKTEFGRGQRCLTIKEAAFFYQEAVDIMNSLAEKADMKPYAPSISLELIKKQADKKRISAILDKLNPEQNRTIEQSEESASFLAFLLLQDSPMLVKKAWKRNFLTGQNLSEAVKFAVSNEKKKILSYLYEYAANENTELEEYVL